MGRRRASLEKLEVLQEVNKTKMAMYMYENVNVIAFVLAYNSRL